jgi:MFS family permease
MIENENRRLRLDGDPHLRAVPANDCATSLGSKTAAIAWVVAAIFYFYQYAMRSAPSVMIPQLSEAFDLSALGMASLIGVFYYGYSVFSLVAGVSLDRLGPRKVLPIAAAVLGAGAMLFASGSVGLASAGRFLQGIGGAFAAVGAIYIASKNFPPSQAATLIGATQMFGMAGGTAGQFAVGPLIGRGFSWQSFWMGMGVAGLAMGAVLFILLPKAQKAAQPGHGLRSSTKPFYIVLKNKQSILCGLIAGLLFIPTTIFDMIWGVRYLQEAHGLDYAAAVIRTASMPMGWIIGCPLLGFLSDRIKRRKPVIIGGALVLLGSLACIMFGPTGVFPRYTLGLLAGIGSGAAMLPYIVIKEANPRQYGGTATGVINFLNFTFSALLGPVYGWLLVRVSGGAVQRELAHYQVAFAPILLGVAVAIALTLLLRETGTAAHGAQTRAEA